MTKTKKQKFLDELHKVNREMREKFSKECADFVSRHPEMTFAEISKQIGIAHGELVAHCQRHNVWRKRGKGSPAFRGNTNE